MPIPLFNSIASWILKKRIHQMELFMKYPNEVQNELLHELIKKASKTETGNLYDFKTIKSYNMFKSRVPLCNYDDDSCWYLEDCNEVDLIEEFSSRKLLKIVDILENYSLLLFHYNNLLYHCVI